MSKPGFFTRLIDNFNMLWFIMALGFGGTGIAGFAFLNYTLDRPDGYKGLMYIQKAQLYAAKMGGFTESIVNYMQGHIITFGVLHILAMILIFTLFFLWRSKHPEKYKAIAEDTTKNSVIIAPALALGMSFNIFLVVGFAYFGEIRKGLADIMPFALGGWLLLWVYTMYTAVKVQTIALTKGFDVDKMHFGWLLVPFALGMTAVAGAGIAAIGAKKLPAESIIPHIAFFFSLVAFMMAAFLLVVKLFSLFKSHYNRGLPEKVEFLPSFLMVVPIITLLAISAFRYGHYFHSATIHGKHMHVPELFYSIVIVGGWAFMVWYIILGLALLKDYFKNHFFDMKYFDESQWGLICPMVAFAVLGSFVYKVALPNNAVIGVILFVMALDVAVLFITIIRQIRKLTMTESSESNAVKSPA